MRAGYADTADVAVAAPKQPIRPPAERPAIRVRSAERVWVQSGRLVGKLLVITFRDDEPLTLSPWPLVDKRTGRVLPQLMGALPGTELKLRAVAPSLPRLSDDGLATVVHRWSVSASLA
ncbi:hypothetical protein GA0070213_13312 [Micromonospora humi]|uniref:Uncharacterized protein n=2 Tax=Micromonospora humi TaxID=745366 RepID=A0A1C5K9V5_9ACTN|nr:hypothetical protein GA0070213_13312 [Micromonospora humi]